MQEPSNASALLREALNLTEGGRTDSELIEMMRNLVRLESEVRAAMSHVVAVATSQGVPESTGHASTAELLKSEYHLSGREASELAVSAVRLRDRLPCTYVALRSGVITWSHATTLVRAVDRLGFGTVQAAEHDWIELIAARTSPETLQRVVNARRLEHDGYLPRTAPKPRTGTDPFTPTDTSTADPEGTTSSTAPEVDSPSFDVVTQHDCPDCATPEPPSELSGRRKVTQPTDRETPESVATVAPTWPLASTTTLSSEAGPTPHEDFAKPTTRCVYPHCTATVTLREISFSVRWLDGGQSTVLCHSLACDEHAVALMDCAVDQIKVGHSSMIWTSEPTHAPHAA
jgi:Domain of unknown function (DUF222)